MTLPQFIDYTPGQIVDRHRSEFMSRLYAAPLKVYTVTIGGTASDGKYAFDVDGTEVPFTADTGAGDDNPAIAVGLFNSSQSNDLPVMEIAAVSLAALVLTLTGRVTGDSFTVDNAVAPGAGTLLVANPEDGVEGSFELGIGCSLVAGTNGEEIRRPMTGDTKIFGVVSESPGIADKTGNAADVDHYDPGSMVYLLRKGPAPVIVEAAVIPGDPIYCRATAAGAEVAGHFRNDADGGDAVLVPGEFLTASRTDTVTGELVAIAQFNLPA